jgi:putative ABC transport system ATP-binding protein
VAIARALVKDPLVVFADEPTGNLDRAGGDRIVQLLRDRLSGNNATVVIVTHDRRFITPEDLVLEIEDGRLKGSPVTPVDSPARGKGGSSGG